MVHPSLFPLVYGVSRKIPVALPRAPRILSNLHASEELIETLAIMHRHEEDSSAQKDTGRQGMSNDVPNVMFPCVSGPHRAHPTP